MPTPRPAAAPESPGHPPLFDLASLWLKAGNRLAGFYSVSGRDAADPDSRWPATFSDDRLDLLARSPAALWLEVGARAAQNIDAAVALAAGTQRALLQAAETQVRLFDDLVIALAGRATAGTPWESRFALNALRLTLEAAEHTMRGMDNAGSEALAVAEAEARLVSEELAENSTRTRPARRGRRTS